MPNENPLNPNIIQNSNGEATLLHSGNFLTAVITDVNQPESPCLGRHPSALHFGSILIAEDIVTGDYNERLHVGDYIVIYRPSTLAENIYRVRQVESTESGTLIHISDSEGSDLDDIEVGDVVIIGINLEEVVPFECLPPTPLKTTRIRTTSARLEFSRESLIEVNRIRYKKLDDNEWIEQDASTGTYYVNISGLETKTQYEWQVMGFCEYPDSYSMYSDSKFFKTS